ncbi:MAG: hypothetical protein IIC18_01665 [Bacteroidetes bacterium]|nr:hypothetical protein [Bacteroidota bacterium]
MVSKLLLSVPMAGVHMACPAPEEQLPEGPPVAIEYEAACDSTNHQRLVILEGYLHLFPRLLPCYPDAGARTGRSCQVKLLPASESPTGSVQEERVYYTTFINEGDRPIEARSRAYGFGSPLKVFTIDSTLLDPYDRVRITGRFHAQVQVSGGDGLLCTLSADRIEIAEVADVSWADEREAKMQELRPRIDSLETLARGKKDVRYRISESP